MDFSSSLSPMCLLLQRRLRVISVIQEHDLHLSVQVMRLLPFIKQLSNRNHIHALSPVSYTHLTLPTNREV